MKNRTLIFLIVVSALGYFVDAFDLLIFSVVRKTSLAEIGVSSADSLSVGLSLLNWQMIGLLLGGVAFGIVGDRKGRLAVLFGSIFLYSVANLLNGFVHSIHGYEALRFVAGFGLAGELGAGIALISEVMSAKNRGIGTVIVATCGLLGAAFASIVGTAMPWRTAFIVGGVMGLILLVLRIGVAESGLYQKVATQTVVRGNFFSLFTSANRLKRYLLCIGVGLPTYFIVGLLVTGAPEFGKALGLAVAPVAGTAVLLCYLSMSAGDVVCSLLSQRLRSRRLPLAFFNCICLISICLYLFVPASSLNGPPEPVWPEEETKCLNELTESVKSQAPYRLLPAIFAENHAKTLFPAVWQERQPEIQQRYQESLAEYEQQLKAAQAEWEARETERIAWLQRLTAGDLEEIKHTLTEIFTGLHLPFQDATQCGLFFDTADLVSLNLDLPEMEQVILLTRKRLLKNGEIREVARDKVERNRDYFDLVTGECVFIAAEVFSYLPLCQTIRLAAYTQRPKARETDPIDTYVLDLKFTREELKAFNPDTTPMHPFSVHSGARFQMAGDYQLARIEPPSWLNHEDIQNAPGE